MYNGQQNIPEFGHFSMDAELETVDTVYSLTFFLTFSSKSFFKE